MRIIQTEVFPFDELDESAQSVALDTCRYWSVEGEWWEFIYEDAERIGMKITGFDIDRANYLDAKFPDGSVTTAKKIVSEHGETCETYSFAKEYLATRERILERMDADPVRELDLESELETTESEFLRAIREEYLSMLRKEFEYLTEDEQVRDMILANGYEFLSNGKMP